MLSCILRSFRINCDILQHQDQKRYKTITASMVKGLVFTMGCEGLSVLGLFVILHVALAIAQCDVGFEDVLATGKCLKTWPATDTCPEGWKKDCDNQSLETTLIDRCYCFRYEQKPLSKYCPENSQKVVLEGRKFPGRKEVFKCSVDVNDEPVSVCNHGMVLDLHSDRCMAAKPVDITCSCPNDYSFDVSKKRCIPDKKAEGSISLELTWSPRFVVELNCSCPKGSLTANEYYARTADSTVNGMRDMLHKTFYPIDGGVMPRERLHRSLSKHPSRYGHGSCFMVEYHDKLTKCSNDRATVTVDSKMNSMPSSNCLNRVLVDPYTTCEEGWKEVCELSKKKICQCERVQNEKLTWKCDKGDLVVKKNKDGGKTGEFVCTNTSESINI